MRNIGINFLNRKELFRNLKNAGLYFLGSIVQSLLALVSQPIYSKYLSAEEFGVLGYFEAIKNLFTPFFVFGITSVYLMFYFKQSEVENKKLLFNLTFYLCCFNTLGVFISYIIIYGYFRYMHVYIPLNPYAWLVLVTLLLDNIRSIVLINFRIRKKALSFFTFSAINSVLNVGIGLWFVAVLNWGAEGRMLAPIISIILMLPVCIYILWKYTTVDFNYSVFLKAVKIAIPLVLASYAFIPITNIDRLFLERLQDLSELGLYNIGITIAGYVQTGFIALGLAFEPDVFKFVAEKNNLKLLAVGLVMFVPYLIFVVVFGLFSETVISILTSGRYVAAAQYTNVAILAVFLMGIFSFFSKIFVATGNTKLNMWVNITGGISSFFIMYIAVNNYRFIGAAYGKVVIAIILVFISAILTINELKLFGKK